MKLTDIGLTDHAKLDRSDRITNIIVNVGIGEPYKERDMMRKGDNRITHEVLTDTGVIMIFNKGNHLITMFLSDIAHAKDFYNGGEVPQWLYKRIMKNRTKMAHLYTK